MVDLPPRYARWASSQGLPVLATTLRSRVSTLDPRFAAAAGHQLPGVVGPGLPSVLGGPAPTLTIRSPSPGLRLLFDPETPRALSTLELRVDVDPGDGPAPSQVLWFVDGAPFRLVDHPEAARWPLEAGRHRIFAELPGLNVRSEQVTVWVE